MRSLFRSRCTNIPRAVCALLIALACAPLVSRADTIASLLGNFTINQFCGLQLESSSIKVHYVVVLGQLPALRELHAADVNGDGVTSQAERDAYVRRLAPEFASRLNVVIDGSPVQLHLDRWTSALPTEQGGFSLRLEAEYSAPLPLTGAKRIRGLRFTNNNYPGRIGWHEIAVKASAPIQVFDTDAYGTSLTSGLTEALQALPATGPLDERAVQMSYGPGGLAVATRGLRTRPGSLPAQAGPSSRTSAQGEAAWLEGRTRALVAVISSPNVAPGVAILALLTALVLGAVHALSPGHGKTLVGAYLVGSHGTPKHALFLGLTVTVTHTLSVFALGFATLFASRFLVPEKLLPILSLVSGLLVFGMGMILLAQRWRGARKVLGTPRYTQMDPAHPVFAPQGAAPHDHVQHDAPHQFHSHGPHAHPHHCHDHDHGHNDGYDHEGGLTHAHGGSVHSHLPLAADGAKVTWRSLLMLGISGGLVPCPSAMVLLLAAVALNRTAYGLLMVVAFSIGLAMTLTAIGLAFLYARNHIRLPRASARWVHLLPVLSAGVITLVGAALCIGALQSAQLR